jgi:hypothetical protein
MSIDLEELRRLCEDAPEEIEHRSGCPAVADDESDYEYLADAGTCTCGAQFASAARNALPELLDRIDRMAFALRAISLDSEDGISRDCARRALEPEVKP